MVATKTLNITTNITNETKAVDLIKDVTSGSFRLTTKAKVTRNLNKSF